MNVNILTKFEVITCPSKDCGVSFAVVEDWADLRRNDHKSFYCPNGHSMSFTGKSETEKMREALEREQRCCELNRTQVRHYREKAEHQELRIRGYMGALAKAKKRSAAT